MSNFHGKDFFGDPFWPKDFTPDPNLLQDSGLPSPFSTFKYTQNQEPSEHSCGSHSSVPESQDPEDLEKEFLTNEEKMLYSNFKHEEITYLEETKKGSGFSEEDLESEERLSEDSLDEDSHDRNLIKEAELKFEEEIYDEIFHTKETENAQGQQNSSSSSELFEEQVSEVKTESVRIKLSRKQKKYELRKQKQNPVSMVNQCKIEEEEMIEEILKETVVEFPKKSKKMVDMEKKILKKLGESEEEPGEKSQKYKILTEAEKEYIVYLSTVSTTCEVARRFNISVNNICRWKKGTKRKVGAGRKIVNLDLEEKMIEFVKNSVGQGEIISRKQIQMKAKEFSRDDGFKASKGWFERFFNRNIEIFGKGATYYHK